MRIIDNVKSEVGEDLFQIISIFLGLFLLMVFFSIGSDFFLTQDNLYTVALQIAPIALISIGQTYVLITAGIDLSIAPTMALAGVVSTKIMTSNLIFVLPSPLLVFVIAIVAALLMGSLVGLINGLAIKYCKLPPFIVTMGAMSYVRGIDLLLTNGRPVTFNTLLNSSEVAERNRQLIEEVKHMFENIGNGTLLSFPIAVLIMIITAIIFSFILSKTKFGNYLHATGSNLNAARLSGVNTIAVTIQAYTISGFLAAMAGLIATARILSAGPNNYVGYELYAVASSVIGGTSLSGGQGLIGGTVIGSFIIGVLRNGLNLMRVSPYTQQVFIGLVIVLSVYLDNLRQKK